MTATTVVSSAYDISGSYARKLVKLTNGWLVATMYNGGTIYFYVSKDSGNTWNELTSYGQSVPSGANLAIASTGTLICAVFSGGTSVQSIAFDVTTFTTVTVNNIGTGYSSIGTGISVATDSNNKFHVAFAANSASYPNNTNIWYSNSVNGTVWSSVSQVTANGDTATPYHNCLEPAIVIPSNGTPVIGMSFKNSNNYYTIGVIGQGITATSFSASAGYGSVDLLGGNSTSTTVITSPVTMVDASGKLHLFWDNGGTAIYHNVSTDGGTTWGTTETAYSGTVTSYTITYVNQTGYFYIYISSSGTLYQVKGVTGSWPAATNIGTGSTPSALWSLYNENSPDAIRYLYQGSGNTSYNSLSMAVAPNAPTLTPSGNFGALSAHTFYWTYSNPNSWDSQSAYELQIINASTSAIAYDTGEVVSSANSFTLPSGTLSNGTQYQWKVSTWGVTGIAGPYSANGTFSVTTPPTVTVTSPTNGTTLTSAITSATLTYSSSSSVAESSYQFQLLASDNVTVVEDSGTIAGTSNSYSFQTVLNNATTYYVQGRATDANSVTSAWSSVSFSTNFVLPPAPTISVVPNSATASIIINITNATSTGSQPTQTSNDVNRRNSGTTAWTRIATQISINGSFSDYAVGSGQDYDYKVTTHANNNTQVDSPLIQNQSVSLNNTGLWLHDVSNPAGTLLNLKYMSNQNSIGGQTSNTKQWKPQSTTLQFAGRPLPVVEFGENLTKTYTKGSVVCLDADGTWSLLETLIETTQTTLCMRDSRGRVVFGNIVDYTETDLVFGRQVDIVLQATAYSISV